MESLIIRPEKEEQYREMENLVREAFWDKYRPGCAEHLLAHNLRTCPAVRADLCRAAEKDGRLAGGIWYAEAAINSPATTQPVLTMGPVAVHPALQGLGIGAALIRTTLRLAEQSGAKAVVIYGDINYYRRFGFEPAEKHGITDGDGNFCPAILIRAFRPVTPGAFAEGEVYQIPAAAIREFDAEFPAKQQHLRSTQLFFVPPAPPPENPLLRRSHAMTGRACALLRQSGILPAWEKNGARVRLAGSLRSGLMLNHRDIDLHIYTPELSVSEGMRTMGEISATTRIKRMEFSNGASTDEQCLEWHLHLDDTAGEEWQIDIIQILAGSRYDGWFENVAERIIDRLTPEKRLTILSLKDQTPPDTAIGGIEYCRAVVESGVRTWEEFQQWRENPANRDCMNWRP